MLKKGISRALGIGGVLLYAGLTAFAAQPPATSIEGLLPQTKLTYRAFDTTSGKLIDVSYAYITQQPTSEQFVQWFIVKDAYTHADEYVLDERWQTKSWKVLLSDKGVDYTGTKKGNRLILEGTFNEKPLHKTIKLKENLPFYYNPKLGLKGFAQSARERMEFWGFRGDNLSTYKMKAEKQGIQDIKLESGTYPAMRIYWSATGMAEPFFNRVYYYRLSDGEFIGQEPCDGWAMQLIELEKGKVRFNEQRVSID